MGKENNSMKGSSVSANKYLAGKLHIQPAEIQLRSLLTSEAVAFLGSRTMASTFIFLNISVKTISVASRS